MIHIFRKIFAFAGQRKKLLVQSIWISFLGSVFTSLQFMALFLLIENILADHRELKTAGSLFVIMLVSIAGKAWATYGSVLRQTETGYGMVIDKRVHIGDRLKYIPMGFFNENNLGRITAVVTTSLGDVENTAARSLAIILSGILQSLAFSIAVLIIDVRIGLVVFGGMIVYLFATELAQRSSGIVSAKRQTAQEELVGAVLEYVQGMSVVKSFNLEASGNQEINDTISESCEKNIKLTLKSVPWDGFKQLIVRAAGTGILLMTVKLYLDGGLGLAKCLLLLIASFMVYSELESAGNMASMLQMLNDSMDKANAIDETPVMDQNGKALVPETMEIVFQDVDFCYEKRDRKVLEDISLVIPEKSTVAVIGPSGGGKSTLCSLIARFWDVTGGSILLGGRDIRSYTLDSLLEHISMVFQNVYLFQDTIENNIKFGRPDATHEDVVKASKAACCDEFIRQLPEGYNTVLGEGGGNLSGGEKQRLSIARAMLKNAPIVILDEATANVDPENEADLQRAIEALTHNKTIIMIAHRLKTVKNADQIFVLDQGHIVQRGRHEELITQPGIYADFIQVRKESASWKVSQS